MDPLRGTPLLVHAGDGKQAFWAEGPVDCEVDDRAMRESGRRRQRDWLALNGGGSEDAAWFRGSNGQSSSLALEPALRLLVARDGVDREFSADDRVHYGIDAVR